MISKLILVLLLLYQVHPQCSSNCDACNSEIQGCLFCKTGYVRNIINRCQEKTVEHCELADLDGSCYLCRQLFNLKQQECIKDFTGCSIYESPDNCGECLFGTRLINKECKGVLNCATYSSESQCETCFGGYTLTNNVCRDFSAGCSQVHEGNGVCLKCKEGYTMSGYVCIQNASLIPYCQLYEPNDPSMNCMRCATGFQYNKDKKQCEMLFFGSLENNVETTTTTTTNTNTQNGGNDEFQNSGSFSSSMETGEGDVSFGGTGGQKIQNCVLQQDGVCLQCEKGRMFFRGKCLLLPSGCLMLSDENVCGTCDKYFTITNGNCVDYNCAVYSGNKCEACLPGFDWNQNIGACIDGGCEVVQDGKCSTCKPEYYLPPNQPSCRKNPEGCRTANSQGTCSLCFSQYILADGVCRKEQAKIAGCVSQENGRCLTCGIGRLLNDGTCLNLFCGFVNQQPCSACLQGYELNQEKTCIDPNCQVYDNHLCRNCKDGYSVDITGKCKKLPDFCLELGINNECTKCIFGYELKGDVCTKQTVSIPNCIKTDLDDPTKCIICSERYYSSTDRSQCMKVPDLCKDYNPQTGFCFNCNHNVDPQDGKCVDGNCLNQNQEGKCLSCRLLYEVSSQTGICQNKDPYCTEVFKNVCQKCAFNYYLDANNYCVELPFGCKVAHFITAECLECHESYQKNQGKCLQIVKIQNCEQVNLQNPNTCLFCSEGYFPEGNGCTKVSSLCKANTYNPTNGFCLGCIDGYNLQSATGRCIDPNCEVRNGDACSRCINNFIIVPNQPCKFSDNNCETITNNRCTACRNGFYLSDSSTCKNLPFGCLQALSNGNCVTCQEGLQPISGVCSDKVQAIDNCMTQQGSVCSECMNRYYLKQNICFKIGDGCNTYNKQTGECWSCFTGYEYQSGICVKKVEPINQDPHCLVFRNNRCQQCSTRYYYSGEKCIPVNPLCKTYNSTGACTTCYPSYRIEGIRCILAPVQDPNCKVSRSDGFCNECFTSYYVKAGKCQRVNLLCKTHDPSNGNCLSCYQGYRVSGGNCVIFFQDPNCRNFDSNGQCIKCVTKHYLSGGKCVPVNPNCKAHDERNGACTECYSGYIISGANCVIGGQALIQPNCKTLNGDICLECYGRFYVDNGRCKQVNPYCKGYDPSNGDCTNCYPGYALSGGKCVVPQAEEIDGNCKRFSDSNSKFCVECYQGYIPLNGICKVRDDQCANYSQSTYECLGCYSGYTLDKGKCVIFSQISGDANCIAFENRACVRCADGFFKNRQGICELADPQCRTYDDFGSCVSCYDGYVLTDNKCYNPRSSNNQVPNCELFDIMGFCSRCIDRYYLKERACHSVSILCAGYNIYTGECLSCNSEYFNLQNGTCVQLSAIIEGCSRYEGPFCAQCETGYYYQFYDCIKVNRNCSKFNYNSKQCEECNAPFTPQGPTCI